MRFFIVMIYLILGIFFMGMFKDSSGKPFGLMAWLWPIFVPIILMCIIFDIIYRIGEKMGGKSNESD